MSESVSGLPTVAATADDGGGAAPSIGPWWSRVPFAVHALVVLALLLVCIPIVGPNASFSADEGAVIVQAQHLAEGHGWIVANPFPQLDPTGRDFPLEISDPAAGGFAPYAKHPLYPLVLAGADHLGGVTGMVLVSVLGAWLAALVAAAIARGLSLGRGVSALWITGALSPLFFDAYLIQAHTLAAASFALAVWAALRMRRYPDPFGGIALCAGTSVTVLLRSEGVLFVGALGVALVVDAVRKRGVGSVISIGIVSVTALVSTFGERWWIREILGTVTNVPANSSGAANGSGFLARVDALRVTWFQPGYSTMTTAVMLVVGAAILVLLAVIGLRLGTRGSPLVMIGAVGAAAVLVARLFFGRIEPIPGLLVAFPAAMGVAALPFRSVWRSRSQTLLALSCAVGFLAVLATEYPTGGGGEWGGRYFAIGVPVLVILLVIVWETRKGALDLPARTVLPWAFVVGSIALSITGILSLRDVHGRRDAVVNTVAAAAAGTIAGDRGRPLVIARGGALPRVAWSILDDGRWQLRTDSIESVLDRAADLGIREVVVATPPGVKPVQPGGVVSDVQDERYVGGWHIQTIELAPGLDVRAERG